MPMHPSKILRQIMSEPHRTLHCWSRAEYDRMVDAGVFSPNVRLKLVDGEIIEYCQPAR